MFVAACVFWIPLSVASPLHPLPVSKMCVKWVLIVILFTRNYHTAQLIYHFLYTTQHQAAASQTPGPSLAAVKKIMKLLLLRCQVLTLQMLCEADHLHWVTRQVFIYLYLASSLLFKCIRANNDQFFNSSQIISLESAELAVYPHSRVALSPSNDPVNYLMSAFYDIDWAALVVVWVPV